MKRFFVCISKHLKCLFAVSSLFLTTVGCAQNAGFFSDDAAGLTFNLDGSTKNITLKSSGEADVDLGTVKSFSLSHFYVNTWKKKDVGNICYPVLNYRIYKKDQGAPNFTERQISTIEKEEEKDGSVNQHWVLDNVVSQGISGDEIYVFEFYVRDPGSQSNPGQCNENIYLNNGSTENYKFFFSANETKFTVTASAYEVSLGESVTLTAHNGQAPYSWSQSTDGGSSFTPISGTDATITVLPIENTVYRCVDSKGASDNVSIVLEIVLECDPASKKNLFKDDFGTLSGDQERKTNEYIPGTGAGGYEYADKCKPLRDGGQYAVVANPKWGGCGDQGRGDNSCDCGGDFWYRDDDFKDHTRNGEYGGMLMIDCKDGSSSDNDILYERKAEGLCANTYTMFSLWVANAANEGKGDPIRMKFKLWNADKTKVISEAEVDGLSFDERWQEVSTMFNTGDNTSVVIQVINKAGYGAAGNDVLIDDISFDACNPKSMLFINGKSDSFTGVCGQDVDLSVSISEGALVMPYYLWQQSLDGSTWSEIEGVSGYKVSKYTIQSGNDTYYRAIVANDKETAEEVASGSATGKCALYSITNMVKSACDAPTLDVTSLEVEDCQGFSGEIYKVTLKNPFDYDLDSISVMNIVAPELTNVDYSATVGTMKDNIWKIIPFAAKSTATLTVSATANTAVKDAENKAYVLRINDGAEYSYDTSVAKGTSTITIFDNPEAAISGPSANICEGSSADLVFSISSGTPNYTLYYKEGSAEKTESGITAAGDKKISVTPTETTTYTLTKVSDANGCYTEYSSENTAVVNVDKKPSAAVIVNPDKDSFSQCGVESFSLEATTPEIGTGKWTITEGTIADPTSASTTTIVAAGSKVTVTWTVSNGVCESKSKSVTLKNAIVPTIEQISASGTEDQTKCSGEAITDFTFELGGSATGYTINPDLSSSGLSCTLVSGKTYKISGTPSASCDVTISTIGQDEACDAATLTFKVTVNPLPTEFAIGGGGTYCSNTDGKEITLSGSENGVDYTLYKDDVATSVVKSGSGSALSFENQKDAGVYTILAKNTTTKCEASMSGSVSIQIDKEPTNNAGVDQDLCNTADFTLAGTATNGKESTWSIKSYTGETNPTITDPTSLTSTVTGVELEAKVTLTLTTTSELGVCEAATDDVTLYNKDCTDLTLTVTAESPICAGATSNYKIEVYNGALVDAKNVSVSYTTPEGDTYTWTIGDIAHETSVTPKECQFTPASTATTGKVSASAYVKSANGVTYASYDEAVSKDKKDIQVNALPVAGSMNVFDNTQCKQPYNGTYTITAEGGSGTGYSYSIDNGENYSSISKYERLKSASVTVKVKDSNGCESKSFAIKVEDKSVAPKSTFEVTGGGSYCADGDGVSVGLNGSETGFTYTLYKDGAVTPTSLSGNGSALNFGNQKVAGTYTVVAGNSVTECSATMTGSATVTVNDVPTIMETVSAKCADDLLSYSIVVTVSEGEVTCSEHATITNDGNVWTISGIESGHDCTLTVTTTAGCTNAMTVIAPDCNCPSIDAPAGAVSSAYCYGTEKSAIKVNTPTEEYAIYWYDAAIGGNKVAEGASYTPEIPGTYYAAKVQKVSGCQSTTRTSATQTQNPLPIAGSKDISDNTQCNSPFNGTYTITASGGSGVYIYSNDNGSTYVDQFVYTGIQVADIFAKVKDSNGCISAENIEIKVNDVSVSPNAFNVTGGGSYCAEGDGVSVGLDGSESGFTYTLYKGETEMTSVEGTGMALDFGKQTEAGEYTVKAENTTTACSAIMGGSVVVSIYDLPIAGKSGVTDNTQCIAPFNGAYTITATGGSGVYTYSIDGGANYSEKNVYEGLQSADVQAKVKDAKGCVSSESVAIKVEDKSVAPKSTFEVTGGGSYCSGGEGVSVGLDGSETGFTYTLYKNDVATSISLEGTGSALDFGKQKEAGVYTVKAENITTACSAIMTGSKGVSIYDLPIAGSTNVINNTNCKPPYNGSYKITAEGGSGNYSYSNNNGESYSSIAIYERLQSADVIAKVRDSNGCVSETGINIKVEDKSVTPTTTFTVTGGGSYCEGGDGVSVGLDGSQTDFTYTLYKDGVATSISLPGNGSALNFGNQKLAGTYTVEAENSTTKCSGTMNGSATVIVNAKPTIKEDVSAKCAPDLLSYSIVVTVSEGTVTCSESAEITNVGNVWTISGVAAGHDCTLTVTTSAGCINTMSVTAPECKCPSIEAPSGAVSSSYCIGSEKSAIKVNSPTEEYAIYWYDAATDGNKVAEGASYTPENPGTYYAAKVQVVSGCQSSTRTPATQTENALPTPTAGSNTPICSGTSLNLSVGPYSSYSWSGPSEFVSTKQNPVIAKATVSASGDYTVEVTDANGCKNTSTTSVTVNALPEAKIEGDAAVCQSSTLTLIGSGADKYSWNGGTYTTVGTYTVSTVTSGSQTIKLKVRDANGCTSPEVSKPITVNAKPEITETVAAKCADDLKSYSIVVTVSEGTVTCSQSATITNVGNVWTISGVATGHDCTLTVTTSEGCINTMSVIAPNCDCPSIEAPAGAVSSSYCYGTEKSAIKVNTPTEEYAIYWYDAAIGGNKVAEGASYTPETPDTYYAAKVQKVSGCQSSTRTPATQTENALPIAGKTDVSDNTQCIAPFNGTYTITADGGSGTGYSYSVNGGEYKTKSKYEELQSADVTVKVKDSNGCVSESVAIKVEDKSVAPKSTFEVTGGGSYCADGDGMPVGLNGSETAFKYTLYRGETVVSSLAGTGSALDFGKQKEAGVYTVKAENAETACSAMMTGSVTVSIYELPIAGKSGVTDNTQCIAPFNGAYTITAEGGSGVYTYSIDGGTTYSEKNIYEGLQSADVLAKVKDENGCVSELSVEIKVEDKSVAPKSTFEVTGGGSYCADGDGMPVGLNGSETAFKYTLYRGETVVSSLAGTGSALDFGKQKEAGVYTVKAENAETACSAIMTGSVEVSIYELPIAGKTDVSDNTQCIAPFNGAYTITADGGSGVYTYSIDGGATYTEKNIYEGLQSADVQAKVKDENGCVSSESVAIKVEDKSVSPKSTFEVTGGGSYCADGDGMSVGLNGSETGFTYTLYKGEAEISSLAGTGSVLDFGKQKESGVYTIKAENVETACSAIMTGSVEVSIYELPIAGKTDVSDNTQCIAPFNGAYTITADGGSGVYTYSIDGGATYSEKNIYEGLQSADVQAKVKDENGCVSSESVAIKVEDKSVSPKSTFEVTGGGSYCADGDGMPVGLNGSETGFTYTLYKGEAEISSLAGTGSVLDFGKQKESGVYTIKAENVETACSAIMTGSVNITEMAITSTPIVKPYDECPIKGDGKLSDLVTSDRSGLQFFDVPDGGTPLEDKFDASTENTSMVYYVSNTELGKCESERAIMNIYVDGTVDIELMADDDEVYAGQQEVTVSAKSIKESPVNAYKWQKNAVILPETGDEVTTLLYSNTKFTVTGEGRCNTVTKDITIRALWPTLITPKTGVNGHFAKSCEITVFNRFNEKVFQGYDGWDGTLDCNFAPKGEIASPGIYYYYINTPDGGTHRGTIEVVKF